MLSVKPRDVWLVLARPVLCALFMTGAVIATIYGLLRHELPLLQLVAGAGVGVVVYVASVRALDVKAFREVTSLILSFFGK
jgi:hypothetical protein